MPTYLWTACTSFFRASIAAVLATFRASIAAVWATSLAPIFSCKAAISLEQPHVGNGADAASPVTAVAPTLSSTQKAVRHFSRRVPLTL